MTIQRVAKFMYLGGQTVPNNTDRALQTIDLMPFVDRVEDELYETIDAIGYFDDTWGLNLLDDEKPPRDYAETLDGFLDIAYAAMTGAIRVVGAAKAAEAWDAICDANEAKVDGRHGPLIRDAETGKILKPEGWTAPDIQAIVDRRVL